MPYRSIAVWPDTIRVGNVAGKNESEDTHETRDQAEGVCRLLERDGFGGEGSVFPLSTRVEEIEPQSVFTLRARLDAALKEEREAAAERT